MKIGNKKEMFILRQIGNVIFFLLLIVGCAHGKKAAGSPKASEKGRIILDESLLKEPTKVAELAAWIAYAGAQGMNKPSPQNSAFSREVFSRELMAKIWGKERSEKPELKDDYLDELLKVMEAGYLEEYVLWYFGKPGWVIPEDAVNRLKSDDFIKWQNKNLAKHEPRTLAIYIPPKQSHQRPLTTGHFLGEIVLAFEEKHLCRDLETGIDAVLSKWEKEENSLPGRLLSVSNGKELLEIQRKLSTSKSNISNSVYWVSPYVWSAYHWAGFCQSEKGNAEEAESYLRKALYLNPLSLGTHSELAHSLSLQGKNDEALELLDAAFELTTDSCQIARLWRKKGFVFFEQKRWKEAKEAYEKSLKYDPRNPLALQELKLIGERLGQKTTDTMHYDVDQQVTECK